MRNRSGSRWRFALRIVFPVFLVIALFVVAFYALIIPGFERSIMDRKSEMIRELTLTAVSVLEQYHADVMAGRLPEEVAKKDAASQIGYLRYGENGKDYFWITDMQPVMIMHPYRKDLNGTDLSGFRDPTGKRLFVEFIRTVRSSAAGDGYVDYMWQWKDDTSRIVPKLSYVKVFKPWGWVIGTGIYLEDVRLEIASLEQGLLKIALAITLVAAILLSFIAVQSYRLEVKRRHAEEHTRRSEEKYRTLVEAASEGTLMLSEGVIVFSNKVLQDLTGFSEQEIMAGGLAGLFGETGKGMLVSLADHAAQGEDSAVRTDTKLTRKEGPVVPVTVSVSRRPFGSGFVHVLVISALNRETMIYRQQENLTAELQASVLLLSRKISEMPHKNLTIPFSRTVSEAARLMTEEGSDAILVQSGNKEILGIVTDEDIRKRAVAERIQADQPVFTIMSAPLIAIPDQAMLFEAISLMQERKISHLAIRNSMGEITGMVSQTSLLKVHQYSLSFVKREVEGASSVHEIRRISGRIPELASSLLQSGADAALLVRFTTVMFNAILDRIIQLALDRMGTPPAPFVFIVMGSAGREEQTLATDQDHAIIFREPEKGDTGDVREWFTRLGKMVSEWLNEAGYRFCKGNIMAGNPAWCQPLGQWKSMFTGWIASAEPQDLLDINIFFDFRPVYGEERLAAELHDHIREQISHHPDFFIYMTGNLQKLKPPLTLFGNIQLGGTRAQPDSFDIKMAMLPLVDIARLYALKKGLTETGTLARLHRLTIEGIFTTDEYNDRAEAYKALMTMRFRHQAARLLSGGEADNFINPDALTHLEQALLKKVLGQTGEFIARVVQEFKAGIQS